VSTNYELSGDVAIVTLARPDRFNAIDAGLSSSLIADLTRAGTEARAVVLTGEGKAFCSGAALTGFVDQSSASGADTAGTDV
jgi:2-(1,2-epoxy-1,2-dihydrophenyl)acetyl-CoA isomerase